MPGHVKAASSQEFKPSSQNINVLTHVDAPQPFCLSSEGFPREAFVDPCFAMVPTSATPTAESRASVLRPTERRSDEVALSSHVGSSEDTGHMGLVSPPRGPSPEPPKRLRLPRRRDPPAERSVEASGSTDDFEFVGGYAQGGVRSRGEAAMALVDRREDSGLSAHLRVPMTEVEKAELLARKQSLSDQLMILEEILDGNVEMLAAYRLERMRADAAPS